ncbi:MAG TPA: excinuclease ABC subunit UvrC [Xanthomonadaceae bacterium]|nr:excinuclease ABC subunit UvrC [Xanthomonadaceae bacterium]
MSGPRDAAGFDGKAYARRLTMAPGVYRLVAADGAVLYVGKAASLRRRVASYFTRVPREPRLAAVVAQIAAVEVSVTRTEGEALLLENQLIKELKPRYNVLLRDDKSYPYIRLTASDPYPRLAFHRGGRPPPDRYFGPYPGAGAVRETLNVLHRLFKLRSCEDSVFRNRTRPCLQYQIERCSAPCVGLVADADYAASVRRAELFLEGRSDALAAELGAEMEAASAALDFEQAARLRDLVAALRKVTTRQYVEGGGGDIDVLACVLAQGRACVLLLAMRGGRNLGTRAFFPRLNGAGDCAEVLGAFVTQYYLEQPAPREIVLDREIEDAALLEQVLGGRAGHRVQIKQHVRGERARFLDLARRTAETTLAAELGSSASQRARMASLTALLALPEAPERIECFDISHTGGEAAVASCVVFGPEGPVRSQYRRYNIAGITPGDDYAAMRQALLRRFRRGQAEGVLPDLLLIDGGKGQLRQAREVLGELGVAGVALVAVAKGAGRRPGLETLVREDGSSLRPGPESPALHLVQQVRDEAHRFAITGHRGRRAKARGHSVLEDVPGIGARRRTGLLRHFGGLAALKQAGVEEIARVPGISNALAQRIYDALHGTGADPTGAGRS